MKHFTKYIVQNLVSNPNDVHIKETIGSNTLILEISVNPADLGKLIGKKGKTINAIRTILLSVASSNGVRVVVEIFEESRNGEKKAVDLQPSSEEESDTEETEALT